MTLISTKTDLFEFSEVESLLLPHEVRVKQQAEVISGISTLNLTQASYKPVDNAPSTESVPQAHFTASGFGVPNRGGRATRGGRFSRGRGCRSGRFGRRRGGRSGRFGGRSNVQCQVCYKVGHDAANCYHRLNVNYVPTYVPPQP